MNESDPPRAIRLGSVGGVPVLLKPSWFLVAAVIILMYLPRYSYLGAGALLIGVGIALILLGSVFVHEVAHAVAARSVGTTPHRIVLDFWGGHTAFEGEVISPLRSAFVSLAGPAANLLLGLATLVVVPGNLDGMPGMFRTSFIYINFGLAIFNALPGLPLDGGRALEAVIWAMTGNRGTGSLVAGWVGRLIAVGVVLYSVVWPLAQGRPVDLTWTIWALMIAALLWQGASAATAAGRLRRKAPALTLTRLARPAVPVPTGAMLSPLLAAPQVSIGLANGAELVVIDTAGRAIGIVDRRALQRVPTQMLTSTSVDSVARRINPDAHVPAGLGGEALLLNLQNNPHPEYVVLEADGRVVAVLAMQAVATALHS